MWCQFLKIIGYEYKQCGGLQVFVFTFCCFSGFSKFFCNEHIGTEAVLGLCLEEIIKYPCSIYRCHKTIVGHVSFCSQVLSPRNQASISQSMFTSLISLSCLFLVILTRCPCSDVLSQSIHTYTAGCSGAQLRQHFGRKFKYDLQDCFWCSVIFCTPFISTSFPLWSSLSCFQGKAKVQPAFCKIPSPECLIPKRWLSSEFQKLYSSS